MITSTHLRCRGRGGYVPINEVKSETDYFDSYTRTSIHRDMIRDSVRTEAYRKAIMDNKHLFKDKVVLDVGCGTGILSLFAAKAGARKVYGVEMSGFAALAGKNVIANDYRFPKMDLLSKVDIIHGRMETVVLPEKVDIIVSEWMGYCLFYESMLDSVLFARDKWLVEGGIILPDKVELYVGAINNEGYKESCEEFFGDHCMGKYGLNMSGMNPLAFKEGVPGMVHQKYIITQDPALVHEIDLMKDKVEDIEFDKDFELKTDTHGTVSGLFTYFNVYFNKCFRDVSFSTSPWHDWTHWSQTSFYFEKPFKVWKDETLIGAFFMKKNKDNFRDLDIGLTVMCTDNETSRVVDQNFRMRF